MNELELEVLWLGYESDPAGLWELPWRREGSVRSEGGPAREEVRDVVVHLAERHLIEVLVGRESIDFEKAETVDPVSVRNLIADDSAWRVAEFGELVVRYRTTDAGFTVYRETSGWVDE